MKVVSNFIYLFILLFSIESFAIELPRANLTPNQYVQNARSFILGICREESARSLYWSELINQGIQPGLNLRGFIVEQSNLETWKHETIKDYYMEGLTLNLATTFEIVVKNKGLSREMYTLLNHNIYDQLLTECFGDDETSKEIFTATLVYADTNTTVKSLGFGYVSNYLAIKWIGLAMKKTGSYAAKAFRSKYAKALTSRLYRAGRYINRYGPRFALLGAGGYAYYGQVVSGYSTAENAITYEQIRIRDMEDKIKNIDNEKSMIEATRTNLFSELYQYRVQGLNDSTVLNQYESDLSILESAIKSLEFEKNNLVLQMCRIITTQKKEVERCLSSKGFKSDL